MIDVVVAGGQRGADLGALRAAAALRLETRGYMPRDFETEDGPAPHIATLYRLLQSDGGYAVRDRQNVDIVGVDGDGDGDGLFLGFLLRLAPMGRGTQQTLAYALTGEYAMPPPSLFEPVEGAQANALPNPVPEQVKEDRFQRVMAKTAAISAAMDVPGPPVMETSKPVGRLCFPKVLSSSPRAVLAPAAR